MLKYLPRYISQLIFCTIIMSHNVFAHTYELQSSKLLVAYEVPGQGPKVTREYTTSKPSINHSGHTVTDTSFHFDGKNRVFSLVRSEPADAVYSGDNFPDRGRVYHSLNGPFAWSSAYIVRNVVIHPDGRAEITRDEINGSTTYNGSFFLSGVCGAPGLIMDTSADLYELSTVYTLTLTGDNGYGKPVYTRTECTYKWKRANVNFKLNITPDRFDIDAATLDGIKRDFVVSLSNDKGLKIPGELSYERVDNGDCSGTLLVGDSYRTWKPGELIPAKQYVDKNMWFKFQPTKPMSCTILLNFNFSVL